MPQTKESFEEYLNKMQEEAAKLTKPKELYGDCPLCPSGVCRLAVGELKHEVEDHIYKGTHYQYVCNSCRAAFTTSNLDTLSIASLKLQSI